MRIKIDKTNTAKIEAALEKVNGRADANTITTFSEVASIARRFEAELTERGLAKVHQRGAELAYVPDFRSLPKAYQGRIITTTLVIERAASGLFLVDVQREHRFSGNPETHEFPISEEQQDIILRHAMRGMNVSAAA